MYNFRFSYFFLSTGRHKLIDDVIGDESNFTRNQKRSGGLKKNDLNKALLPLAKNQMN